MPEQLPTCLRACLGKTVNSVVLPANGVEVIKKDPSNPKFYMFNQRLLLVFCKGFCFQSSMLPQQCLQSDLVFNVSKLRSEAVSESEKKLNDAVVTITEKGPQWFEVRRNLI